MDSLVSRSKRTLCIMLAIMGLVILIVPKTATAQDVLGKLFADQFGKSIGEALKRQVKVNPPVNSITDSIKTITIELEHQSDEAITAKLTLSKLPPSFKAANAKGDFDSLKKKSSLLDDEENNKDTAVTGYKPMGDWIKGVPETITIAPGEKKKLTLTVAIPAGVSAGEYAVWIITEVKPGEKTAFKSPMIGSTKLIYKK